jgi:hypothetical protein
VLALAARAQPRRYRIQLRLSALNGLASVHDMRGQYAEAIARAAVRKMEKSTGVSRAVRLDPGSAAAHTSLASVVHARKRGSWLRYLPMPLRPHR